MAYKSEPYGDVETAEQVKARLAAIQRAAATPLGPLGPKLGESTSGATPIDLTHRRGEQGAPEMYAGLGPTGIVGPAGPQAPAGSAMERSLAAARGSQPTAQLGTGTDMNALRAEAERRAAEANAANAARNTTPTAATTGGSLASVINQPPTTQPPTTAPTTGQTTNLRPTTTTINAAASDSLARAQQEHAGQIDAGVYGGTTDAGTATIDAGADRIQDQSAGAGAGAGPAGAGSGVIQGGDLGALTSSIMTQLQGIGQSLVAPGNAPDVGGVFMQQAQGILKMLDDQEAQLRAESEKSGTTIDPATQFTIDKIREGLEDNLKTTREDLNRRGVYDSGITLDLESKLRKGSASDQAMILASRLSKLQDELTKGLSGIRGQKVSTLQSFGRDAAQSQFTSDENTRRMAYDKEQNALQAMLNLRSQLGGEANSAANRSFQGEQSSLDRSFQGNESALQRAYGEAQSKAQTAAQFEQNRLAYERERALVDQRASSGAYGGAGGSAPRSTATRSTTATGAPQDNTADAIADLKAVFTNANEATAAIKEQMAELAAAGVDIAQLFNAAEGLGRRRAGTSDY